MGYKVYTKRYKVGWRWKRHWEVVVTTGKQQQTRRFYKAADLNAFLTKLQGKASQTAVRED